MSVLGPAPPAAPTSSEIYNVEVDPAAVNNAHAITVAMIGRDRRVLEFGCGHGHVTAAIAANGNTVVGVEIDPEGAEAARAHAEQIHVLDLDHDPLDPIEGAFDVLVFGDVLEHLRDPWSVLADALRFLAPGGQVIVSLPNAAHLDLRLGLLAGSWNYRAYGLLDRTHLRFFTLDTARELLAASGLVEEAMERVTVPVFGTEIGAPRNLLPTPVLEELMTAPEADTYQFVFRATVGDPLLGAAQRLHREHAAEHVFLVSDLERRRLEVAGLETTVEQLEADRRIADDVQAQQARRRDRERAERVDALIRAIGNEEARQRAVRGGRLFRRTKTARRLYAGLRRRLAPRRHE